MSKGVIPTVLLLTEEERAQLKEIGGSYIDGVRQLLAEHGNSETPVSEYVYPDPTLRAVHCANELPEM